MSTKTVVVPNIHCSHCIHTIEMEVGEIKGVKRVEADEASQKVTIEWEEPADWDTIEALLKEISYPPEATVPTDS